MTRRTSTFGCGIRWVGTKDLKETIRAHIQSQRSLWTSWTPGLSDHRLIQATDPAFLSWLGCLSSHTQWWWWGKVYKEARRLRKKKKKTGQWARAAMYSPPPGGKIFISETKQLSYSITKRKAFHSLKEQGQRWYIGILLHAVEIIYNFIIK